MRIGDGGTEVAEPISFELEFGVVKITVQFLDFFEGLQKVGPVHVNGVYDDLVTAVKPDIPPEQTHLRLACPAGVF